MKRKKLTSIIMATSIMSTLVLNSEYVYATENEFKGEVANSKVESISKSSNKKGQVVNVNTNLRIREKPNTDSKVIGYLTNGQTLEIKGIAGQWYYINASGKMGYAHKDYIKELNQGSSNNGDSFNQGTSNEGELQTSGSGQVINVKTNLRVRQKASTDSMVIGYLRNGQSFDIKSKAGNWYYIKVNEKYGYVHKDYVRELSENITKPEPPKDDNTANFGKGQIINISTSLRIRKSPNTTSVVIGYLINDEIVNIKGRSGEWYNIEAKGKVGYIHSDYVKELGGDLPPVIEQPSKPEISNPTEKPESVPLPENPQKEEVGEVYNISTNLRVRNKPSSDGQVLAYLLPGEKVKILGYTGDWYYINSENKYGYAHKNYIRNINNSISPEVKPDDTTNTENNSTYNKVLNVMKEQLESPYIYGGSGEIITMSLLDSLKSRFTSHAERGFYDINSKYINGQYRAFDCSGLMQWAFKQAGINIGRTTKNQINNGIEVALTEIKPGDLLFYSDLNHVGMYVGDDKWIESPNKGGVVQIVKVPWNRVSRARRVI